MLEIMPKLLFTVNKTWRRRVQRVRHGGEKRVREGGERENSYSKMCFFISHLNYFGRTTTDCVSVFMLLFYLFSCSVYLQGLCVCVWEYFCVHTWALIPDSPSNYLNCAYRSYCTVHFPLESYTLSSFMSAALAIEISTLGNFVLHNKFCT